MKERESERKAGVIELFFLSCRVHLLSRSNLTYIELSLEIVTLSRVAQE